MGGHYKKGLFHQLMEVQARLEGMEEAHKKDRKEVQSLTKEVKGMREENQTLRRINASIFQLLVCKQKTSRVNCFQEIEGGGESIWRKFAKHWRLIVRW